MKWVEQLGMGGTAEFDFRLQVGQAACISFW